MLPILGLLVLVLGILGASRAHAAPMLPCDILAAKTPCVAAHSTTRALYASYDGPLYQVARQSDGNTRDIGVLAAGGYADAAAQDAFCAGTYCMISRIYDQSPRHNDLTVEGGGVASFGRPDVGAPAEALPVTAGGHQVYGISFSGGMGYRNDATNGVAAHGQPEAMYMVTSGTHANADCCFDYGNAELHNDDPGDGHMDAINFGTRCFFAPCAGSGPWVLADLENGLFESDRGSSESPTYSGNPQPFVTAMLKNNGQNRFALKSADATAGTLFTIFDGPEPSNQPGYAPMQQEGAIVLGTGGDNSNGSIGSFFEGVMTAGFPTDDVDAEVQANIVSVGYGAPTGATGTLSPGSEVSLRATTACCTGEYLRHQNGGVVISPVSTGSPVADRADATWIVRRGLANNSCVSFESRNYPGDFIRHSNSRLYRQPYDGSQLMASDATFCPVAGMNGRGNSFQSANYTTEFIRHYDSTGFIASDGGPDAWDGASSWTDDVSWIVSAPLAN